MKRPTWARSSAPRKPGRKQGIPRYRRPGQTALVIPFPGRKSPSCVVCNDRGCEFCPRA